MEQSSFHVSRAQAMTAKLTLLRCDNCTRIADTTGVSRLSCSETVPKGKPIAKTCYA